MISDYEMQDEGISYVSVALARESGVSFADSKKPHVWKHGVFVY